mmetsp:Transcript_13809/g.37065  ORF Transcript_13809/g.37065 Transcript_13809/m.37065 type:complete len:658 (+) Transcript_13809:83-2056(+)
MGGSRTLGGASVMEEMGLGHVEPLERYFAFEDVQHWLLTPCTMDKVCPGAMECAFRMELRFCELENSVLQRGTPLDAPFMTSENLFVPAGCNGRFIMGTVYGDNHPHIFSSVHAHDAKDLKNALAQQPKTFCRRFCADLACPTGLEWVEVSWLNDGQVLVHTTVVRDHGALDSRVFVFAQSAAGFLSSNMARVCSIRDLSICCSDCADRRRVCACESTDERPRGSIQKFVPVWSWHSWIEELEALRSITSLVETQRFDMQQAKFLSPALVFLETRPFSSHSKELDSLKKRYIADLLLRHNGTMIFRDTSLAKAAAESFSCDPNSNAVCHQEFDLDEVSANLRGMALDGGSANSVPRTRKAAHTHSLLYEAAVPGAEPDPEATHGVVVARPENEQLGTVKRAKAEDSADAFWNSREDFTERNRTAKFEALTRTPSSQLETIEFFSDPDMLGEEKIDVGAVDDGVFDDATFNAVLEAAECVDPIGPSEDASPASGTFSVAPPHNVKLDSGIASLVAFFERPTSGSGDSEQAAAVSSRDAQDSRNRPGSSKPGNFAQGSGMHVCEHCGARFSTPSNMRKHARIVHLGERRHVCSQCGVAFAQSTDLRRHVRSRHREGSREVSEQDGVSGHDGSFAQSADAEEDNVSSLHVMVRSKVDATS